MFNQSPLRSGRLASILAFAYAALAGAAEAAIKPSQHNPNGGRDHARGGAGTKAFQRAAQKRRNQARHRKACRA